MRRAQNGEGVRTSLYGSKMCGLTRRFVLYFINIFFLGNDIIAIIRDIEYNSEYTET